MTSQISDYSPGGAMFVNAREGEEREREVTRQKSL